ncbi:hypothetical protein COV61_02425, partial [Candidatus Micrarchaeota archaeon CG11_big_fil_rev_8_21_14_0_20_47_5]
MKKTVFLAVFILALAGMLCALNNEQVVLSKKADMPGYAGFEVTRELVVTDNPKISIARDVAVHEYGSKIVLKIKNIGEFERANIYIEQDFGELIGEGKDETGRHVDWEWNPVPSSVKWGVASHSYSRME